MNDEFQDFLRIIGILENYGANFSTEVGAYIGDRFYRINIVRSDKMIDIMEELSLRGFEVSYSAGTGWKFYTPVEVLVNESPEQSNAHH